MGRVFVSPRMGVRATAERWCRAGRGLRDADRDALERLAGMAMAYSSQGFFAFDDPLEAAIVAVLAGLVREEERSASGAGPGGNGIVGGG